jgi:hypothetical protein
MCLFLLAVWSVHAGDRWNVRAMGMGRTSVAASRGIEALSINPANLAQPGRRPFSLGLAPLGVRVSTEMFSYDIYQEYFTGIPGTNTDGKRDPRVLNDQDKQTILSSLPDGLAATKIDLEAMDLGATITTEAFGGMGFAILDHASSSLEIPKDFARFYLTGLDSAGSHYSFDGTSVTASWWREFNFSYAYRFALHTSWAQDISVGISLKLLQGFGIIETDHYSASVANQRIRTNQYLLNAQFDYRTHRAGSDFFNPDKNVDMSIFPEPAGTGTGFDLGMTARIQPGLTVAASITDIGSIEWTGNVVKTDGHYSLSMDDPFSTENSDSLDEAIQGKNQKGDPFSSSLPTTLRIGAFISSDESPMFSFLPAKMLLAFDYTHGLNSSMGNVIRPRFSLGMEYRGISFLPLRTGISMGGGEGVRWAAGLGVDLGAFCLDVATENIGMIFTPKSTQMISLAAGMKINL